MQEAGSLRTGLGLTRVLLLLVLAVAAATAAGFEAGVARVKVTPEEPIWLSGYASRTHPSEGVLTDLYVRALALRDSSGNSLIIVSADLIGLPGELVDEVSARVIKQYELDRPQLLFNASHTHTGPVVWPNFGTMYDLPPKQVEILRRYNRRLAEALFTVIGAALGDLSPAALSFGQGAATFALPRRDFRPDSGVGTGVDPIGRFDHSIPVIRVNGSDGQLRAVVFGYACHNTTLTGHHYRISGDYAGYAAGALEESNPGAVAVFLALCGGDQHPTPRGKLDHVEIHGQSLASEVSRVMKSRLAPIAPPIRAAFQMVDLPFRYHTREQFEKELQSEDSARVRRAQKMLAAYDSRHPIRSVAYPVQAVRLGNGLTLLALGGEVVVDYALRAKREFAGERLIVAGYSNDVMCYIPSLRVLRKGGYEADYSMVHYGQPGPFSDDVEERVFDTIRQVMRRVGVRERR